MNSALKNTIYVALGGAIGTLFRHGINVLTFSEQFPLGTVIENLTGALALGLVTGFITTLNRAPDWLRTGVGVGFCGGYTTMSTFAADTFLLGVHSAPGLTLLYVGSSLVGGLLMAAGGIGLGKMAGDARGKRGLS